MSGVCGHKRKRKQKKRWPAVPVLALAGWLLWSLYIYEPPVRECGPAEGETCRIVYLLNLDGMKGLGHSALLLVDENGAGELFSYNGMQYNLFECLLGKEGIGKMKQFSLDREAVGILLETGELRVEGCDECVGFDRVLYRYIPREQYEAVMRESAGYVEIGDTFERLYAQASDAAGGETSGAGARLEAFLGQRDIPRYQIYTHNCDTAARELAALADEGLAAYNKEAKLTPNGNYKAMCRKLDGRWGFMPLGDDSLAERLLDCIVVL